jgi:uncharacterized protein YkwD
MKYHSLFITACALVASFNSIAQADVSTSMPTDPAVNTAAISPTIPASPSEQPATMPTVVMNSSELAILDRVNAYRKSQNLPPLTLDPVISAQAKAHSEEMARAGKIGHEGFNDRVQSVAKEIVYRSAAENVGYSVGYAQPDAIAVEDWINSPGHQKNMVGRYDLTGIGMAKNAQGETYFTQIFIRKAWYVRDAE